MFSDTKNVISDTTFFEHAICAFLTIFSKTQHPQSIAVDFFNIGLILLFDVFPKHQPQNSRLLCSKRAQFSSSTHG